MYPGAYVAAETAITAQGDVNGIPDFFILDQETANMGVRVHAYSELCDIPGFGPVWVQYIFKLFRAFPRDRTGISVLNFQRYGRVKPSQAPEGYVDDDGTIRVHRGDV